MVNTPPIARSRPFVDTHCHVDLYDDPKAIVERAEALGVRTIAVTNTPSTFPFVRDLTAHCCFVRAAVGLHPVLAHSHDHELDLFWPNLEQTRYVGEVGLDYVTTDQNIRALQRSVFSAIVERCATYRNKILTVHSRRSAADVIAILGGDFPGRAILHWFSGTPRQLQRGADAGCYFSVNPSMLSSKSGRSLIASMPQNRVLTETDGPFVKVGDRPAMPSDVALAVEGIAEVWKLSPEETRALIIRNLKTLLV